MRLVRTLALVGLFGLALPVSGLSAPGDPGMPGDGPGMQRPGPRARPGMRPGGGPAARGAVAEQRLLVWLQANDKERYDKVVAVKTAKPQLYQDLVLPAAMGLRQRNIEMYTRFQRVVDETYTLHEQIDAYIAADGKKRDKVKAEMTATVGRLFDLRQEYRRDQLAKLEQRVAKIRADIEARDANKEKLVDEFTSGLIGGAP